MARRCPICSSSESDTIKQIGYKDVDYQIGKCQECEFVYVINPCLDTTYDNQNVDISKIRIPAPKKRHFQIKKLIDTHYRNRSKIEVAEIGSGYGSLAKIFAEDSSYDYCGFEPSAIRVKVCQSHGLNVKNTLFNSEAIARLFDVIIIDNVLEHVLEPKKLIENAAKALKINGLLVVIVPNYYDIRQYKKSWRDKNFWQPRFHINYFTSKDLKSLFEENNISFHPFGLSSLDLKKDLLFVPKVFLDSISIYKLGLYCYGVKRS